MDKILITSIVGIAEIILYIAMDFMFKKITQLIEKYSSLGDYNMVTRTVSEFKTFTATIFVLLNMMITCIIIFV
jgi:hypothetical protein